MIDLLLLTRPARNLRIKEFILETSHAESNDTKIILGANTLYLNDLLERFREINGLTLNQQIHKIKFTTRHRFINIDLEDY